MSLLLTRTVAHDLQIDGQALVQALRLDLHGLMPILRILRAFHDLRIINDRFMAEQRACSLN